MAAKLVGQLKRRAIKGIKLSAKLVLDPKDVKRELRSFYQNRKNNLSRSVSYQKWFKQHYPTREQLAQQTREAKKFSQRPLISIILPIYNTNQKHLRQCIESVINQSYPNWEICVADDASTTDVLSVVKAYKTKYPKKIKWTRLKENQHIAGSSNEALRLAKGEFVALLDHDDWLMPNALFEVVKRINEQPETDFVYSDEDKIDDRGRHSDPFFKPDWSPEFLRSCNYITHFAVLRRSIVERIGGFRVGTQGAQDWDLFLRFTQKSQRVEHIPKILYAWRKSPVSTATSAEAKPYAYINQLRVLRDDLKARGQTAAVLPTGSLGFWKVHYFVQGTPLVSIVIPTKNNLKLVKACVESITSLTAYPFYEIVLVDTGSTDKKLLDLYKSNWAKLNYVRVVRQNKPFNFSSACNFGASKAKGDYLLFLNDDTEVITPEWIETMLGFAQQPGVGMVGCKLIFPNGHVQHAGVVLSQRDVAFHPFYGQNQGHDIFNNIFIFNNRNTAAVTAACAMVARAAFNKVNGFDEKLRITYNDVDLCLRLVKAGYRNIYTPYAELYHHESMSVGKISTSARDADEFNAAKALMVERWSEWLKRDPYYNDNFVQHGPTGYALVKD